MHVFRAPSQTGSGSNCRGSVLHSHLEERARIRRPGDDIIVRDVPKVLGLLPRRLQVDGEVRSWESPNSILLTLELLLSKSSQFPIVLYMFRMLGCLSKVA